jgi:hypothetical protein
MYMGKLEDAATGEDIREWMYRGRRVVLTFDLLSDTSAYAVFNGNTKPFLCVREPAFDLEELEACTQELQHILGDGCMKSSPAIVRMKNTSQCDTTALLALVESLKECANRISHRYAQGLYASGAQDPEDPESGTVCWLGRQAEQ